MQINVGIQGLKEGTNILDVNVPEYMRQRRKTGISWFDESLGGEGMVPTQVMMLTGAPGAGKTTLVLQLADSIMKAGHIALYNTGEESLYQTKLVVERLKLKTGFIVGQDTLCSALLEKADNLMAANPTKQVFVLQDSLQTLNDGKYKDMGVTSNTPVRCCEMLTNWAKSKRPGDRFGIVAFIGQATKGGDFAGKNTIRHIVDTHGMLYFDEDKRSETWGERLFETTKNRMGCAAKTFIIGMDKDGLKEKGHIKFEAR